MGWLSVVLGIVAAVLLYGTGHPIVFGIAVMGTLVSFWSWGVMHNYAMEAAKRRPDFSGAFFDITPTEANLVPNWITWLNIFSTIITIAVLIAALIIRLS